MKPLNKAIKLMVETLESIAYEDVQEAVMIDYWKKQKNLAPTCAMDTELARKALKVYRDATKEIK